MGGYSLVSAKQRESIEGNDKTVGQRNESTQGNTPGFSPGYVFIGNDMPKTDLSRCDSIYAAFSITLIGYNASDGLNPLDDFEGISATGDVPCEKECRTGVVGSTYSSYPVLCTFNYPVCKNNCDQYVTGWSYTQGNYGLLVDSPEAGIYIINKFIKDYAEASWDRLMETAGVQVKRLYWSVPISIILGIVACFTMESEEKDSEPGMQLTS